MRRILMAAAVTATLALPASVLALTVGTPAASAASSVTCAKMKGTETGPVQVKKCSVPKADKHTYKTVNGNAAQLATGGTLTWLPVGTTTVISSPTLSSPTGNCPSKDSEVRATGTVLGGTSAVTHAGDTFSATVCITSKGKVKEAKGIPIQL